MASFVVRAPGEWSVCGVQDWSTAPASLEEVLDRVVASGAGPSSPGDERLQDQTNYQEGSAILDADLPLVEIGGWVGLAFDGHVLIERADGPLAPGALLRTP